MVECIWRRRLLLLLTRYDVVGVESLLRLDVCALNDVRGQVGVRRLCGAGDEGLVVSPASQVMRLLVHNTSTSQTLVHNTSSDIIVISVHKHLEQ